MTITELILQHNITNTQFNLLVSCKTYSKILNILEKYPVLSTFYDTTRIKSSIGMSTDTVYKYGNLLAKRIYITEENK